MEDGVGAFDSRLIALRNRGFEVAAPTGELASQEMLHIEEQAELASKIKSMVLDLPRQYEDEKQRFLTRLINPLEAVAVDIDLRRLLRHHRPWVMMAERVQNKWSDEGRSVELVRILERLDELDDAVVMASPRILSMIEDVSPMRKIEAVLTEIERRHVERIDALNGMIEMLDERGWDVSTIRSGTIYDQFSEVDRLHSLDQVLSRCQRKIENSVRPFGHNIAEKLWGAATMAQNEGSDEALRRVEREIDDTERDLSERLEIVEARIAGWQSEGFQVQAKLPLLANEMMVWEAKLPTIADKIEATHAIWARMEVHLAQWPEYRRLAERTRGYLGAIESLEVLLEGLTSKTEGARASCLARLDAWASFGICTDTWGPLVESEPRAILEELDAHQPFVDVLIPLIEKLESLDTSIDGGTMVDELLNNLRSSTADIGHAEMAKEWLELATNRRVRHRAYLNEARIDLATLWPADLDPGGLDLATYENAITELETHGVINSEKAVKRDEIDSRLSRVIQGLKKEIDDWRYLGWSVEGLLEMLARDPVKLGLDLPSIRVAMSKQKQRVARLSPLPWALNVELAERVLSELRRPECLAGLDDDFQDLMHSLASAEGAENPDFKFTGFLPSNPISSIEKKLPVLVPVEENVVEEEEGMPLAEVENPEELEIEEPVVEKTSVANDVVVDRSTIGLGVLELLGVDSELDLDQLLMPPLDVRVQRLARIALLLEQGDGEGHKSLQGRLPAIAKKLQSWTVERLSRRHASSGNGLLKDAKLLGERLADIPGPGAAMPLSADRFPLPSLDDLDGLELAIGRLENSVMLPSALIQMPEAVEA